MKEVEQIKPKKIISDWIAEETRTADLGDKRLNIRLGNLLDMLSDNPSKSIPATANGWSETKAAYRFFDNDSVTAEKILQPHLDATINRIRNEPVVLLPQDTTELNYSGMPQTQGLGKLNSEKQLGMLLHPSIAITPERMCLGVVDVQIIIRKELHRQRSHHYLLPIIAFMITSMPYYELISWSLLLSKSLKTPRPESLPIEEKETIKWLNSYRVAQKLAEQLPNTQIVSIADREGDVYELFVETLILNDVKEHRAEFIIRASKDRILKKDKTNTAKNNIKLKKRVSEAPVLGTIEFDMPTAKNRKSRPVIQEVRAASVVLKPTKRIGSKLPEVTINVVFAKEIKTPCGEEPIEWFLITSLPINTIEKAIQVITWYLCRWQIEIFFKILKSGCGVEKLQLQTIDRLKPSLALYMIIGWRILAMTMLGRSCPDIACTAVLDDEEWRAVYIVVHRSPPPKIPPTLNNMIRMIASLGGFLNRKNDGDPGVKTIWTGLQRIKDFVMAMEALDASRR
jgi:Transposase Tn5 dimerisation domain/Transposase DNA-binding